MKLLILLSTLLFSALSFAEVDQIIVYKKEREMIFMSKGEVYKTYQIRLSFANNNPLYRAGPKRLRGDGQTPEGNYKIVKKRQHTAYRMSLLINYPNKKDIAWGKKNGYSKYELGDMILIHGEKIKPTKKILKYAAKLGIEEETVDEWAKSYFYPFFDWTNGCIAVNEFEMEEIFEDIKTGTKIDIYPRRPLKPYNMRNFSFNL